MNYSEMEELVKTGLEELMAEPAAWDLVLDLLERRALRDAYVSQRVVRGMTRADLAAQLGVTEASVTRFEEENWPDPHLSTLRRYSLALGLVVRTDVFDKPPALGSDGQPIVEATAGALKEN